MIRDYFTLAYKGAKGRKIRSWLTMIGIFVGIAAVVALISLSQGLRVAIQEQFASLGTDKLVVQAAGGGFGPPGTGVTIPIGEKEKRAVNKVDGVKLAVGRLIRVVEFKKGSQTKYSFATTLPDNSQERELVIEANQYKLQQGKLPEGTNEVLIGSNFAADFFDKPLELRDRITIQGRVFKVAGILQKSGNPQKDETAVLPEQAMRDILGVKENIDVLAVQAQSGEDMELLAQKIEKELRKVRRVEEGKEDFTVQTPGQLLSTLDTILAIVQGVLVGVAGISLVVGGIGIMNTMYTAVVQRTREIGIMKALGARNSAIRLLFLIESGMLGLMGGIIGVLLGLGMSKTVEIVAYQVFGSPLIKAQISVLLIIGALLFAFLIGAISGYLPARQASKLHPVEALRK